MFKSIPGYEGIYEISKKGHVRRIDNYSQGRPLKYRFRSGYPIVQLSKQGKVTSYYVHRLVLITWDRLPESGEQTRHLDHNRLNCHINNLKWGTATKNMNDMIQADRCCGQRGCKNSLGETFTSLAKAARHYNVAHTTIRQACQGKYKSCGLIWSYI